MILFLQSFENLINYVIFYGSFLTKLKSKLLLKLHIKYQSDNFFFKMLLFKKPVNTKPRKKIFFERFVFYKIFNDTVDSSSGVGTWFVCGIGIGLIQFFAFTQGVS